MLLLCTEQEEGDWTTQPRCVAKHGGLGMCIPSGLSACVRLLAAHACFPAFGCMAYRRKPPRECPSSKCPSSKSTCFVLQGLASGGVWARPTMLSLNLPSPGDLPVSPFQEHDRKRECL